MARAIEAAANRFMVRRSRSGRNERRAQLVAPGTRVAPADDVVVRAAVCRDDLSVADEKHHRVRTVVRPLGVLVVDPHAHAPAVLERTQRRVLLIELSRARFELDNRVAGVEQPWREIIPDELLVVLGART